MKILFLQTAHPANDDRIWHQMKTLRAAGHDCAYAQCMEAGAAYDVAICDTPKAILRSVGHGMTIVYDVTEWYPSKKNLRQFSKWLRPFVASVMWVANMLAGCLTDAFIFGEEDKARPFRRLFPWKKYIYLPYYPSLELFPKAGVEQRGMQALYAGPLTEEKGYFRAVAAAQQAGVPLTVVGPENYMPLQDFCSYIGAYEIGLDLRDRDAENRKCLPIKLFYYMAAGVVPVYSDLDAIRHQVPEWQEVCFLVRNQQQAVTCLEQLRGNADVAYLMRKRARQLFEEKYNWEVVAPRLLQLLSLLE